MDYYNSLFIEFFSSLSYPQFHPFSSYLSAQSLPIIPTLMTPPQMMIETGRTYNYRLSSCQWFGNYSHHFTSSSQSFPSFAEIRNITCRNMKFTSIHQDLLLLQTLANLLPWDYVCIGLVCGNISPLYISASRHLLHWERFHSQFKFPTIKDIFDGLNDLRK